MLLTLGLRGGDERSRAAWAGGAVAGGARAARTLEAMSRWHAEPMNGRAGRGNGLALAASALPERVRAGAEQAGRPRAEVALVTSGECGAGIWYELDCG